MNKTVLYTILFLWLIPQFCMPERYLTIDPDGFTYIREKPDVRSKIIGKVERYKPFYHANTICGNDECYESVPENWLPVMIDNETGTIGYVYRKYIREIEYSDPLPLLEPILFNTRQVTFTHQQTTISIGVKPLESVDEIPSFISSPENWAIGGYISEGRFYIRQIIISTPHKTYTFPEDCIYKFIFLNNPLGRFWLEDYQGVTVRIGHFGELYIRMNGGDGAEAFSVIWTIVDGELFWEDIWRAC